MYKQDDPMVVRILLFVYFVFCLHFHPGSKASSSTKPSKSGMEENRQTSLERTLEVNDDLLMFAHAEPLLGAVAFHFLHQKNKTTRNL